MQNRRTFLCTASAMFAALATSAVSAAETTKLTVQLAWLPNSAYAGEIVALQKGYFSEAGLDVTLLPGGPGANTVQELLSDTAQISVGYAPQIMYAAERGLPVRTFAASFQKAPLTFVSLAEANITSVHDWKGKRIGASQDAMPQVKAVLHENGMTFEDITFVQAQVPALMQGQVDVIATWLSNVAQNQPIVDHPAGWNEQSIWDNGLQFQSNYYIARKETLAGDADRLIAFLEAVDRGWAYAADHPQESVDLMVTYSPALEADKEIASLKVITENYIYTQETKTNGFGNVSSERWQKTLDTYAAIGEIRDDIDAADVFDPSILQVAKRTKR